MRWWCVQELWLDIPQEHSFFRWARQSELPAISGLEGALAEYDQRFEAAHVSRQFFGLAEEALQGELLHTILACADRERFFCTSLLWCYQ